MTTLIDGKYEISVSLVLQSPSIAQERQSGWISDSVSDMYVRIELMIWSQSRA